MKINKIVPLIKTATITESNFVLRVAGNIVTEMVGYKNTEMTGNRQPNWRRRILQTQKVLRKELGQLNRLRQRELLNKSIISNLKESSVHKEKF